MDFLQRQQFCYDVDHDFSVIAPAGVGKTFSIVERIYTLADKFPEELAHLHVITYTKKAAESLQKRALTRIKQHPRFKQIVYFFNQSFFGTIHSLCWNHIRKFDANHYELLLDDLTLRERFLLSWGKENFVNSSFRNVLRFIDLDVLLKVMDNVSPLNCEVSETTSYSELYKLNLMPIYNYTPEPRNRIAITRKQKEIQDWQTQYNAEGFLVLPECSSGGEKFKQVFYETFEPFFDWLGQNAYNFVEKLSKDYFEYRLAQGYLKHSDLIDHAKQLLNRPFVQDFFKQNKVSIILDEAQDTDINQFQYLQTLCSFNPKSHFSMVGDPQQAIYSRADLQYYLDLHKRLVDDGKCKELIFSKTFRCPQVIVNVLNKIFPGILNSQVDAKQVNYVSLVSASKVSGEYQEIKLKESSTIDDPISYEIKLIAEFLKEYSLKKQIDLSKVCLLCPRNDWLNEIQTYLAANGVTLQLYSNNVTFRDNVFFCTILAFIHLLNFPNDSFEIAGMLYGTFCFSEKDITCFQGELQIIEEQSGQNEIKSKLNQLVKFRNEILEMAPWQGVLAIVDNFSPYCNEDVTNTACRNIILETVFQAQQLGQGWVEIEKKLCQYLDTAIEEIADVLPNTVQGYSCYKAKGLEWDTVILPFFYRPIRHHQMQYPCIFGYKLVFNKYAKNFSSELNLSRKRELQRLLYVACTRAKKHLVIINDKLLWKSEASSPSFGDLLEETY